MGPNATFVYFNSCDVKMTGRYGATHFCAEIRMKPSYLVSYSQIMTIVSVTSKQNGLNHTRIIHKGTILVAHDCGYPLSRELEHENLSPYTCRTNDFLDFTAFLCRCSSSVAPHPPKILVSHLSPPPISGRCRTVNLGLKRCRATRGCRRYSCGCRATLCN